MRCSGIGLEETSVGGRTCRGCWGTGRVPVKQPACAGVCGPNGGRPHHEVREISPEGENRFFSGPGDFSVIKKANPLDLSNKKLIAVCGNRYLEQVSETEGRVIIPSENYEGPIHSIASIAARGYWEPLVKKVVENVIRSTTHDHSQKRKEMKNNERKRKTDHGADG